MPASRAYRTDGGTSQAELDQRRKNGVKRTKPITDLPWKVNLKEYKIVMNRVDGQWLMYINNGAEGIHPTDIEHYLFRLVRELEAMLGGRA